MSSNEENPPRDGEGDRRTKAGGGGGPEILKQPFKQVRRARQLRKKMSLPQVLLWRELRKRPGGYKFRKEFPLHPYTIDFVCLSSRLAIEVDGIAHDMGDNPHRDLLRNRFLMQQGFQVLRLLALDVLRDPDICVIGIVEACRSAGPPPPSLRDGPPPRAGEDW